MFIKKFFKKWRIARRKVKAGRMQRMWHKKRSFWHVRKAARTRPARYPRKRPDVWTHKGRRTYLKAYH